MNTSLRRISVTVMALIVLLLLNATLTQVFTADGLRADPRNQRVLLDEYSRQRGQITAGGQLLAYSVATDSRFRFLRVYPNAAVYAPVTGFYSLRYSSTGLERAEDPLLNGSDERLFGRRLADFFTGRDPRGGNVDTTINPRIQQAGWDAMQQGCGGAVQRRGRRAGTVHRQDPGDGVVAVLRPQPAGLARSRGAGADLAATSRRPPLAPDQPRHLGDLSARFDVQGDHHRGGAAGRRRPNEQLTAAARIPLPDSTATLENYGGTPAALTPPSRCVRRSPCRATPRSSSWACPPAPTRCAAWRIHSAWTAPRASFRCRSPNPPSGPIADAAALGMSSIGQKDVALTPLENAEVAAAIANSGVMMQPYLVDSLKGPDLANISTTAPYQQRRAVSPQVAAKLTELMVGAEKVAQQKGAIPGVQIASKTGTAEHGTDPRHTPPHAWYIAFAPAQTPKVAVAVLVEDGGDRLSATGGALAAPIGRAVIEAALQGGP